ncbi:MAG: pseudouridine synthase [Chloroflexota bacterium]
MPASQSQSQPPKQGERLQKVMARAGIGSRRACEELIRQGRVAVNGRLITELGTRIDPHHDAVAVDGEPIQTPSEPIYLLLHKPPGYLSTTTDPHGRPTVLQFVPGNVRVYPVGRLDQESEGLLLLTNDGPLTERLTHPRHQHEREYRVLVRGRPGRQALQALRQGITLEDGPTAPARVWLVLDEPAPHGNTWLGMVLREGRKRQIRRMCAAVGHPVQRLIRLRIGPLHLGDLKPGATRRLTRQEIKTLKSSVTRQADARRRSGRRK